jgi:phosphate starvation-inducible membrane PsiE
MQVVGNALAKLLNVFPMGTFLMFQVLAPSTTNNKNYRMIEKVVTNIILFVLSALC